jgi:hypothetical protein
MFGEKRAAPPHHPGRGNRGPGGTGAQDSGEGFRAYPLKANRADRETGDDPVTSDDTTLSSDPSGTTSQERSRSQRAWYRTHPES